MDFQEPKFKNGGLLDAQIAVKQMQEEKDKESLKREARRFWITTSISIAAILIAGIALLAELGLITLPQLRTPQEPISAHGVPTDSQISHKTNLRIFHLNDAL